MNGRSKRGAIAEFEGLGVEIIKTSAKTGEGVEVAFTLLSEKLLMKSPETY
jgi:hypothetical protein